VLVVDITNDETLPLQLVETPTRNELVPLQADPM
jgi:hypothetical protein